MAEPYLITSLVSVGIVLTMISFQEASYMFLWSDELDCPEGDTELIHYSYMVYRGGEWRHYVDAIHMATSSWIRYINGGRHPGETNVEAYQCYDKIFTILSRDVAPGTELLINYGPEFYKTFLRGWHNRMNSRMGPTDGELNLYVLVPLLYSEAKGVTVQHKLMSDGKLKRQQRQSTRALQGKLFSLWDRYVDGDLSVGELVKEVADVYNPPAYFTRV